MVRLAETMEESVSLRQSFGELVRIGIVVRYEDLERMLHEPVGEGEWRRGSKSL